MQELWEALSIELGASFKNQYGDASGSVFEYWERELSIFNREEIQRGFIRFKDSSSTFINLKSFRKHCRTEEEKAVISDKRALETLEEQKRNRRITSEKSVEIGRKTLSKLLGK